MKLPRDLSGSQLAQFLSLYSYTISRQSGSHLRLTTTDQGEHHITIPDLESLRVGTLAGIFADVAAHFKVSRDEVVSKFFPH